MIKKFDSVALTTDLPEHGLAKDDIGMHGSRPIPIVTLKSIIKGSGLDVEDFR